MEAEAWKTQREAYGRAQDALAQERRVEALDKSGFNIGEDLTDKISPEVLKTGQDYGRIERKVSPDAYKGNEEDFIERSYFSGSPEQRMKADKDKSFNSIIEKLQQNNAPAEVIQKMLLNQAFGGDMSAAQMNSMFPDKTVEDEPVYAIDAKGNPRPTGKSVPSNARFTQEDRTPTTPRNRAPIRLGMSKTPEGNVVVLYDPDDVDPTTNKAGTIRHVPVPSDITEEIKPIVTPQSQINKPLIPPGSATNLSKLRASFEGAYAKTPGSPFAKNEMLKFVNAAEMAVANGEFKNEDVRATILDILNRVKAGQRDPRSVEQLIETHKAQFPDQRDLLEFAQWIQLIKGR